MNEEYLQYLRNTYFFLDDVYRDCLPDRAK